MEDQNEGIPRYWEFLEELRPKVRAYVKAGNDLSEYFRTNLEKVHKGLLNREHRLDLLDKKQKHVLERMEKVSLGNKKLTKLFKRLKNYTPKFSSLFRKGREFPHIAPKLSMAAFGLSEDQANKPRTRSSTAAAAATVTASATAGTSSSLYSSNENQQSYPAEKDVVGRGVKALTDLIENQQEALRGGLIVANAALIAANDEYEEIEEDSDMEDTDSGDEESKTTGGSPSKVSNDPNETAKESGPLLKPGVPRRGKNWNMLQKSAIEFVSRAGQTKGQSKSPIVESFGNGASKKETKSVQSSAHSSRKEDCMERASAAETLKALADSVVSGRERGTKRTRVDAETVDAAKNAGSAGGTAVTSLPKSGEQQVVETSQLAHACVGEKSTMNAEIHSGESDAQARNQYVAKRTESNIDGSSHSGFAYGSGVQVPCNYGGWGGVNTGPYSHLNEPSGPSNWNWNAQCNSGAYGGSSMGGGSEYLGGANHGNPAFVFGGPANAKRASTNIDGCQNYTPAPTPIGTATYAAGQSNAPASTTFGRGTGTTVVGQSNAVAPLSFVGGNEPYAMAQSNHSTLATFGVGNADFMAGQSSNPAEGTVGGGNAAYALGQSNPSAPISFGRGNATYAMGQGNNPASTTFGVSNAAYMAGQGNIPAPTTYGGSHGAYVGGQNNATTATFGSGNAGYAVGLSSNSAPNTRRGNAAHAVGQHNSLVPTNFGGSIATGQNNFSGPRAFEGGNQSNVGGQLPAPPGTPFGGHLVAGGRGGEQVTSSSSPYGGPLISGGLATEPGIFDLGIDSANNSVYETL